MILQSNSSLFSNSRLGINLFFTLSIYKSSSVLNNGNLHSGQSCSKICFSFCLYPLSTIFKKLTSFSYLSVLDIINSHLISLTSIILFEDFGLPRFEIIIFYYILIKIKNKKQIKLN